MAARKFVVSATSYNKVHFGTERPAVQHRHWRPSVSLVM